VSTCTTGTCPHDKDVFIWLPDGAPYPWVHARPVGPSQLEVCDAMPFATAAEAGEAA
jgi:hypothetical protein